MYQHWAGYCWSILIQFHSTLLAALGCAPGAWQPWTASPRLPCPLASSWKHWQEIWGWEEEEVGQFTLLSTCSLSQRGGGRQLLFLSTALSFWGTQLTPPAPSCQGWHFLGPQPCLVGFLYPEHGLLVQFPSTDHFWVCCLLGLWLTNMMKKADKSLPLHSDKQSHRQNSHGYKEENKAMW